MTEPSKLSPDLNNLENTNTSPEANLVPEKPKDSEIQEQVTKEENPKDVLDTFDFNDVDNQPIDINDIMAVIGESKSQDTKNTDELQIWRTEYEKKILPIPIKKEIKKEVEEIEQNIIYDINLTSLEILLSILLEKQYDFATFEPSENSVKVVFRKEKVIKETKYIKYPTYTNILFKAKSLTKLTIEESKDEQEWAWEIEIEWKNYKVVTKVVPSSFWSKLFIKVKETVKKVVTKEAKKRSIGKIFAYLWIIAFIALIIWGAFIGFVVLNAKTVEDVKFFYSLWINLNDINSFILMAVTIIFSILIFIETLVLIVYLFKFALTKKEFKQKKIRFWIISALILIITFTTGSAWMIIDKKIRWLPNWQEMAYGDVQIYDNSKLISDKFDKWLALLKDTSNLIGPMQIKFDLNYFAKSEERKWLTIKKYIWAFWNGDIKETPIPTIIYDFKEKWNYEVKLTLQEVDFQWKPIEKVVDSIPNINISYSVVINEKILNNWWKIVDFDATWLKELGKMEWYFMDDLLKPVWTWNKFIIWKPIFEETLVWMYIRRNDKKSEELDKLFIISWEDKSKLDWKITYTRSLIDDLEYELKLENTKNDIWNWYIEEYKWIIDDKEFTKQWDVTNPSEASKIKIKFKWYWEQEIKVIIKNSAWEIKEIKAKIDVPKILKLSSPLRIESEWKAVANMKYDTKLNEYYIDEIWVPTEIILDARFIKTNNLLYTLKKVSFDYNSDWDIDEVTKIWKYQASIEWNHTITTHLEFVNRRIATDIIKMKEVVYIEWIKKEAILTFDINKSTPYVPVTVSFDASKSQVKNENIDKFIWNYWDWVEEERDAIVPGHKYTTPWEYIIKLKVITTSWKQYTTSQSLVLKPKAQSVKISTSMLKAPIWQWIDFTSDESEWQIVWYFWNFWDWATSTEANPTHNYSKAWKFKITLKLDFANKNILEDTIELEITE